MTDPRPSSSLFLRLDLQFAPNVSDDRIVQNLGRTCVHRRAVVHLEMVSCSVRDFSECWINLLNPDFRFGCGTFTHPISRHALISRAPHEEPRQNG
jgi:hypothetical protein